MKPESNLSERKCVPCEGGVEPLRGEEIRGYLEEDEGWNLVEERKITKSYEFQNFREALEFVNSVGQVAEKEGHHPDIHLSWGKVVIDLWTHAIGGLSENDFILAAKTDGARRSL
jgi:4a-hydroxytetrahydrobiopterin dehydratase